LSLGPLKWDLEFTPDVAGQYRLAFAIWNLTMTQQPPTLTQLRLSFLMSNYTLSWNDIPDSLNTTTSISKDKFTLAIDLGKILAGSRVQVDPSIVDTCTPNCAPTTNRVRRTLFDPKGGYYWVFYDTGSQLVYRNSRDGMTWSSATQIPLADNPIHVLDSNVDEHIPVYYSGQNVIVANGGLWHYNGSSPYTAYGYVYYSIGNITGSQILWGGIRYWDTPSRTCDNGNPGTACTMWIGVRFVNLIASSDGTPAVSYNWFSYGPGIGICPGMVGGGENAIVVRYKTQRLVASCFLSPGLLNVDGLYRFSTIVPTDSHGGLRVLYPEYSGGLFSQRLDGLNHTEAAETISPSGRWTQWSASADTGYGIHVVYQGINSNVSYAYRSASGSCCIPSLNIF